MEYANVVRDFAERTRHNLEFIRAALKKPDQEAAAHKQAEVYEVTQLINSMLGLLVFPQQEYFEAIPRTPLRDLVAEGWPELDVTPGLPDQVDNLSDLMRYLRNAITHFNVKFLAPSGHLEGLRVCNRRHGKKTWEAELSLEQLEKITDQFIGMILSQEGKHASKDQKTVASVSPCHRSSE
jgi:hypothetical protein